MCSYKPPQTFFKAQFHFKTQKQRFSDDLKVKSVVGDCDDHAVCVDELVKYLKISSTVCLQSFVSCLFTKIYSVMKINLKSY